MIYFYDVKLRYFKNNESFIILYPHISFLELSDFLCNKMKKHSSCEIYSIKGHYSDWR